MIEEFAAAKINLTLEVRGRRPDGYHELDSLVAFSRDAGDRLVLEPGPQLAFETHGVEAAAIHGPNLVERVVRAILHHFPDLGSGRFILEKHLPVASGIGGGSADAAAAIRALARANAIADPVAAYGSLALTLGADIPVCIGGSGCAAAFMGGIGDDVWRPATGTLLPPGDLAAVLVNPREAVSTAAVFAALAAPALRPGATPSSRPNQFPTTEECLSFIAASRNDLEAPAIAIAPVIGDVLCALRALPQCRLARMSGSGATCFALFDGWDQACHAAMALTRTEPHWWVTATRLS